MLLVASLDLRGPIFAESVVLLLHYDETGALGLVVNRPSNRAPTEVLPQLGDLATGTLYLGGPVEIFTVRSLVRTDIPPNGAVHIFDQVYLAPFDATLLQGPSDASRQRFFLGYAGWAPQQLEAEIARGSWHIRPATAELVFARNPSDIWQELVPRAEYRVSTDIGQISAMR